jgi:hypothetical protein
MSALVILDLLRSGTGSTLIARFELESGLTGVGGARPTE